MKTSNIFLILFIFLFSPTITQAQETIEVYAKLLYPVLDHSAGDTVRVNGVKSNPTTGKKQYLINSRIVGSSKYVNEDRLNIFDENLDFWERIWFEYRAEEVNKNGWEKDKRQELHEDAIDYYSQALANNMVFQDDLLYDYLYQLLYHIHPTPLVKDKTTNFSLVILNSTEPTSFAFDNGMIVLTAGLIASTNSEEELINILAQNVAHSVMEHNLVNLNRAIKQERRARIWGTVAAVASATAMAVDQAQNGTFHDYTLAADLGLSVYFLSAGTLGNIGAQYTDLQKRTAKVIGGNYLKTYPETVILDDYSFTNQIASTISFTAWQEYHLKNYSYAQMLAQKLNTLNMATDKDFLLLSKIQRKISGDRNSNQLALEYIEMAKKKSVNPLPELYQEAGMIYTRLNESEKANEAFLKYRDELMTLKAQGSQVDAELDRINQYLQRKPSRTPPLAEKGVEIPEEN